MSNHTPGTWREGRCGSIVTDELPTTTERDIDHFGGEPIAEMVAPENRAIIAAAPDMYRVLKEATRRLKSAEYPFLLSDILSALAKAEKAVPVETTKEGEAPPIPSLDDLRRAMQERRVNYSSTAAGVRVDDELLLFLEGISGRLDAIEDRAKHPLIVGTYTAPVKAPDELESLHQSVRTQEKRIAELTRLVNFARALFARITQGDHRYRDFAHVGELVLAVGEGVTLGPRRAEFDREIQALGKLHGVTIRIEGGER